MSHYTQRLTSFAWFAILVLAFWLLVFATVAWSGHKPVTPTSPTCPAYYMMTPKGLCIPVPVPLPNSSTTTGTVPANTHTGGFTTP